jgi:type I restriction enzyme M protein
MAYWEETMQDDAHIITTDGWSAGNDVIRLQKGNNGKKKDIQGLEGLEGRLIPIPLLIKTYFAAEQTKLDELGTRLEEIAAQMDELKEEHGDEEGLLFEVIDNDKISKGAVQKRIKEIKTDADFADELRMLEKYFALFEKEADTKKEIKEAEKDLERKVVAKYPKFTAEEVKTIVVERKWMDALEMSVHEEVDRLSQRLAGRVKELAERYEQPLPDLADKVEGLTGKVDEHLKIMGFNF